MDLEGFGPFLFGAAFAAFA